MLKAFETRSSFEKPEITANENAWSEFSSLFDDSNDYDQNDLRSLFQIYYEASLKDRKLMDSISFDNETDNENGLQLTILNALFNANRMRKFI